MGVFRSFKSLSRKTAVCSWEYLSAVRVEMHCLVQGTCLLSEWRCTMWFGVPVRCQSDTHALKLKVKDLKFGCVWIRPSCHHMIKRESAYRTHVALLHAPPCDSAMEEFSLSSSWQQNVLSLGSLEYRDKLLCVLFLLICKWLGKLAKIEGTGNKAKVSTGTWCLWFQWIKWLRDEYFCTGIKSRIFLFQCTTMSVSETRPNLVAQCSWPPTSKLSVWVQSLGST